MKYGLLICLILLVIAFPVYANETIEEEFWEEVSSKIEGYPQDIAELLNNPPGTEVINLGEKGLEEGDDIIPYFRDYVEADTQILVPGGTYAMDGSYIVEDENVSIIGMGEVILERPHENHNYILVDTPGDFQIWNFTLQGVMGPNNTVAMSGRTRNPDATLLFWNIKLKDGSVEGDVTGFFVYREHAGELYLIDAHIYGFADNGLYGSAPGAEGQGSVHVYGGVYKNNNITNVRIGSPDSSIRNVISIHDQLAPLGVKHGYARNQRSIWVWPADNIKIENVNIIQTIGWNPIIIRAGSGSGTMDNIRILTESSNPAITVNDGQEWEGSNIHLTGGGNYNITGAEFTNIFYDEEAEPPAKEAFELRHETVEKKAVFLLAEGFSAEEYLKVSEYLTEKSALVEEAGAEEGTVTSDDGEVTAEIEKLTELKIDDYDLLFIPGETSYEPGSEKLDWISEFYNAGGLISAVSEGIDVLKDAGIEPKEQGIVLDGNLLTADNAEYIPQLNLKFAELLGISTRNVRVEDQELEITTGYISPGKLNIFWETDDPEALTFSEALVEQALERAKEEYDSDEHRGYSVYIDPEARKIMDGEWEEAGFKTVWEAAEELIKKFAHTGPHAPDRDPETLYNLFSSSPVYRDLSGEELNQLDKRYYEDEGDKTFLLYSSDPDKEVEDFKSEEVTINHDRGDRWNYGVQLNIEPGVEYRAIIKSEGEFGKIFTLTPPFEPEAFEVSFSNSSWRSFESLNRSFGF